MRGERQGASARIWALAGVGAAGLATVLLIPGPHFEPYHAPPDPARVFRLPPPDSAPGPVPTDGKGPGPVTPPRLINLDEMLAYLGNEEAVYNQQSWARDTVVLQVRIDEMGRVGPTRLLSGSQEILGVAQSHERNARYAPALDSAGAPVAVWWPVPYHLHVPMTLDMKGMARGPLKGRPIPPGGFSFEDLVDSVPTFTPLTELPVVQNPDEVSRATESAASSASAFAALPVLFLIDETGQVRRVQVDGYSGTSPEFVTVLDVARVYRFSPARGGDRPVPAWVRIWIRLDRTD